MDEGLVAIEHAVPSGEEISLQPALALVLREHLHHPALGRLVLVRGQDLGVELAVRHLEDRAEPVRSGLVRAEDPERVAVSIDDVTEECAEHARRLGRRGARRRHVHRVVAEVGQREVAQQQAAIRVRIRAHPPVAPRRQLGELRDERAVGVEQLLRPVAPQPAFEKREVLRVRTNFSERDLVGTPGPLRGQAVNLLRPGPALGAAQHDHRPVRTLRGSLICWCIRAGSSPSTKYG